MLRIIEIAGETPALQRGEAGERWVGNAFGVDEDRKGFAHAFGKNKRFQEEAGADALGFGLAFVVEVREFIGAAQGKQKAGL